MGERKAERKRKTNRAGADCWVEGEGAPLPWLAIYLWLCSGPSCCRFKVRSLAVNQAQDCENTHAATSHAEPSRNATSLQGAPSRASTQRCTTSAVDPRDPPRGGKTLRVSLDGRDGAEVQVGREVAGGRVWVKQMFIRSDRLDTSECVKYEQIQGNIDATANTGTVALNKKKKILIEN